MGAFITPQYLAVSGKAPADERMNGGALGELGGPPGLFVYKTCWESQQCRGGVGRVKRRHVEGFCTIPLPSEARVQATSGSEGEMEACEVRCPVSIWCAERMGEGRAEEGDSLLAGVQRRFVGVAASDLPRLLGWERS